MLLLALLVGPRGPAVALGDNATGLIERSATGGAVEHLPLLVRDAVRAAGLEFGALGALAVCIGPGRFTAVRAAVAAARALALALGRGVYALDAFELGAHAVDGPATVVVPAGREQVGLRFFSAPDAARGAPVLVSRSEVPRLLEGAEPLVLVDPDADLVGAAAGRALVLESSARQLWTAAQARAARGARPVSGPLVRPLYLRPPDARPEAGRPLVCRS